MGWRETLKDIQSRYPETAGDERPFHGKPIKKQKAMDLIVTREWLKHRIELLDRGGYPKAKWIEFCEAMMDHGLQVVLYEARRTVSKYVTVRDGEKRYVVRFSNHKPIRDRELAGDCDCFVGRTHTGWRTTETAI